MSSTFPDESGQPEYIGFHEPAEGRRDGSGGGRGRRWGLVAGGVGVLAVVGAGAWGLSSFLSGGESPATAVPADAVGYVSLDLDPSAGQKIEAIRILNKFPALDDELDLDSRDDLRRWVFEQVQSEGTCKGIDYDADIAPWIGNRIALAAVPDDKAGALPMVALQVSDQDAAASAVTKLNACAGGDGEQLSGVAFTGDYLVLAETQPQADRFAAAAENRPLAEDAQFQDWTRQAGDPGIVTMYVSADAPGLLLNRAGDSFGGGDSQSLDAVPGVGDDGIDAVVKSFKGMAGVVRFRDGGVEAEIVGATPGAFAGAADRATGVADLPDTTAAAISVAFPEGWVRDYLDQLAKVLGGGQSVDDALAQAEAETGLELPEDAETLLGHGLSAALDASVDFQTLLTSPDPTQVPAGVRVEGDPARITAVVEKLKASLGPEADLLVVKGGDGAVGVGLDEAYVDRLLENGTLGETDAFRGAVPDADVANSVLFVNFDAGDGWAERLTDRLSGGDPGARANVAPLVALGVSGWAEDGVVHGLVRLTTD